MNLKKITDRDLQGYGVIGMEDTPNLSARQMQEKVEEVVRSVVIPVMNENIDNTVSKKELAEAVMNSGSGDMLARFYDNDMDGTVNRADNGIFLYTHSGNTLTGKGVNGRFKATSDGVFTAFDVNDTVCSVKQGEDNEIELVSDAWYSFILDGNTINFKQGGAGLNFKIVGGTTQPASPKENTIWVNTDLEITGWALDTEAPGYLSPGGVWIKTGTNGTLEINAVKKNSIYIYPQSCMQWDGTQWINREVKVYKNGQWLALRIWFLQKNNLFVETTGGWTAIDAPNGAHVPAAITDEGMVFGTQGVYFWEMATVSPIDFTTINTLYFSVPRISDSSGYDRKLSIGINPERTHKLVNYSEEEGWLVEKFILNPTEATILIYALDTSNVNSPCYILAVTGCSADTSLTVVIDEIYGV